MPRLQRTIAPCLHCKGAKPIKARGLCQRCFDQSDVRREYPFVQRRNAANWKTCKHCQQLRSMESRGLCRRCFSDQDIRARYPAVSRQEMGRRFAAWRHRNATIDRAVGITETIMPEVVYAVVRIIASPLSGKLRVMVAWFPTCGEAEKIAERCSRNFSCRVERWTCATRAGNERRAKRGKRTRTRGRMGWSTVAVYPRRGGKRVAA